MKKLYIGEPLTFAVDIDTSASDDDYPLGGELSATVAKPGSPDAVVTPTVTITDAEEGMVDVAFTVEQSEDLEEGEWVCHVMDSEGLSLAEFRFLAVLRATDSGDFERDVLRLPFSAYELAGGRDIPHEKWERYAAEAARVVMDATMRRARDAFDDHAEQITDALLRVAEALYAADTGVVSESLGGYSYSVAEPPTRRDAAHVAVMALSGTGLTYRGL